MPKHAASASAPIATFVASLVAALLIALTPPSAAAAHPLRIVELFQSRDCANCPAAQANLDALAGHGDVLALSYPVSFRAAAQWPAAQVRPEFVARHIAYAAATGVGEVATPQMVLNGRLALRGSDAAEVAVMIRNATTIEGRQRLRANADRLLVSGTRLPGRPLDIWLIGFDRRPNPGLGHGEVDSQAYRNIVTRIERLGIWRGTRLALRLPRPSGDDPGNGRAVLLQQPDAGPILAAIELADTASPPPAAAAAPRLPPAARGRGAARRRG